jgi:hypothetical protein
VSAHWAGFEIGSKVSPFMRREMLHHSGFTSDDLDCHLMTLGEYICMYLFTWSDVLWTRQLIPSRDEVIANVRANMEVTTLPIGVLPPKDPIPNHITNLIEFRRTLTAVRRALANIPFYTIMDDHEVTDDWNMTLGICKGMYGNALGARIVQNGLVAYSLCQHWGNAPEQFEDANPGPPTPPPGLSLLRSLDGGDAAQYANNSPAICTRVGVHDAAAIGAKKAVFHDTGALTYNYWVVGPSHQVIVTDTRTWRSFPFGDDWGGELLPGSQIAAQIGGAPDPGGRALLVVLSTNAPPIETIRTATYYSTLSNAFSNVPDIFESWELPSRAFDRLMKAISDKLPLVGAERRGQAMLLSGDVHMSFASRLLFKATSRYEDPQTPKQPVTAVFAQLVASSFKKQTGSFKDKDGTIGFHVGGYAFSPHAQFLIPPYVPEGYVGWNVPAGQKKVVGQMLLENGMKFPFQVKGPVTSPIVTRDKVVINASQQDYGYTLVYLKAVTEGVVPPSPPQVPALPAGASSAERKQALDAFKVAAGGYRTYNSSSASARQIVGLNNVCEITFEGGPSVPTKVNHTVRWRDPFTQAEIFSTYAVSFDPNDKDFPEITPAPVTP